MANNIDKEYEDYLKQQDIDAEYEAYKAQQAPAEKKDYLAETVMSPEFQQPGVPSEETFSKGLVGAANVADVIGSSARAGISEAVKGYNPFEFPTTMEELKAGPEAVGRFAKGAGEQLVKNIRSPLTAPMEAPSMGEIIGRELRTRTIPNVLLPESVKRQGETLGGVFSELAMPAFETGVLAKGIKAIPKAQQSLDSFLSGSKQAIKNVERKQIQNILNKNVLPTQLKKEGFKTEDISSVLVEEDLSKYATNTDDMLDALQGSEKAKYTTAGPGLVKKEVVSKSPGLIRAKSDAMRSEIVELAKKNNIEVQVPAFSVKQKLLEENAIMDPLSGLRYSPEVIQEREKIINEILKPYEEEWVPGIPLEAVKPNFRLEVPPPTPARQPDLFPMGINEKSVPPTVPLEEPIAPMGHGGIVKKETQESFNNIKKEFDDMKAKLEAETAKEKAAGRALDTKIMNAKVEQAADRFIEKAKKNEKYKKEIMDADEEYRQHLIESLNRKVFNKPRHWSIEDMITLRTNLGKRMNSADFFSDKVLPVEKDVVEGLYRSLREEIASKLEGIPTSIKGPDGMPLMATEYYDLQSDALNKMIQAKEILINAKNKGLKDPDLPAKTIATVTGLGAFGMASMANMMMGGNVSLPATALGMGAAAAGYGATKAAAPGVLARGAGLARKGIEAAEKSPEALARMLSTGSRQARDNYIMENKSKFPKVFGREPQSLNIEDVKIPRSIQGILSNKEMVLEKLASTGMSDNLYRSIAYGLNKSPKNLPNVIPLLMTEYPDIFEEDPSSYNLLDGKFIDSNEAAKAADETSKRSDLNSVQKAKIINEINKNKKWIGDK